MKVRPYKYYYMVCPHCESKKHKAIAVVHMGSNYSLEMAHVNQTGYLCGNCGRYFKTSEEKYIYDRAEMKRDIKRLQNFLIFGKE